MELEDAVIQSAVKKAIVDAAPKLDEIVAVDVLYNEGGRWNTIEVSWKEYLSILQTGQFDDGMKLLQLVAVCVNEKIIELEDGSDVKVRVIYDFVLKHSEKDPWRVS